MDSERLNELFCLLKEWFCHLDESIVSQLKRLHKDQVEQTELLERVLHCLENNRQREIETRLYKWQKKMSEYKKVDGLKTLGRKRQCLHLSKQVLNARSEIKSEVDCIDGLDNKKLFDDVIDDLLRDATFFHSKLTNDDEVCNALNNQQKDHDPKAALGGLTKGHLEKTSPHSRKKTENLASKLNEHFKDDSGVLVTKTATGYRISCDKDPPEGYDWKDVGNDYHICHLTEEEAKTLLGGGGRPKRNPVDPHDVDA